MVSGDRWLGDLGVSSQSMAPGLSDGDSVGNGSSWPGAHDGHTRGLDSDPQAPCLHLLRPRDAALPGPCQAMSLKTAAVGPRLTAQAPVGLPRHSALPVANEAATCALRAAAVLLVR